MMTEELREKIAQWLFFRDWDKNFTTGIYFNGDWEEGLEEWQRENYRKEASQILALIKEVGWKSPEEIAEIIKKSAYALSDKHTREVAEARVGYVKLAADQSLPELPIPDGATGQGQNSFVELNQANLIKEIIWRYNKANFRRVELEEEPKKSTFMCPSCQEEKPLSTRTANGECRKCRGSYA
jgi:hypothetical protein